MALWAAMAGIYGSRWSSSYGETPNEGGAGRLWHRGLQDLTDAQVRAGIDACTRAVDDWPPTLPAFRRMAIGIPSKAVAMDAAFGRAIPPGETAQRFLIAMERRIDRYSLRRMDAEKAERHVGRAYAATLQAIMDGEPLPDMPVAALTTELYQRRTAGNLRELTDADLPQRQPSTPESRAAAQAARERLSRIMRGESA